MLTVVLIASACSSRERDPNPQSSPVAREGAAPTALVGWALAGGPLDGAKVTVVDSDAKALDVEDVSLESGAWVLNLEDPPDDFTVVVAGGTDNGAAFEGELRALVRGYDHAEPRVLSVSPATTLVAAYLDAHPDLSPADATKAVASFLELPDAVDLEADLVDSDAWFSGSTFMAEAERAGGVGALVDSLVTELDDGATHAFPPAPTNQATAVATTVATTGITDLQILGGIGSGVSIVAGIVGIIRGQEQTAALTEIAGNLNTLASEIVTLNNQLSALTAAVEQNDYSDSISTETSNLAAKAKTSYGLYKRMVAARTDDDAADREAAITAFTASIYSPGHDYRPLFSGSDGTGGIDGIYADMVPVGGAPRALGEWTTFAGTGKDRYLTPATQARAAYAVQYWTTLQTQVLAMNLAYENAFNSVTPAPSPLVDMNTAGDVKAFAGSNVAKMQSACVSAGGPTSSNNHLLDEFNASGACIEALPTTPTVFIDQATNAMWLYKGKGQVALSDVTTEQAAQTASSSWLPKVTTPEWTLPALADLQNLIGQSVGSWTPAGVVDGLDQLGTYGAIPFFGQLLADTKNPALTMPADYTTTFWTNSTVGETYSYKPPSSLFASQVNVTYQRSFDLVTDAPINAVCVGATLSGSSTSCSEVLSLDIGVTAETQADLLWYRAVPSSEGPYATPGAITG